MHPRPTPPGTGKGLIKGELLRYLRTNSDAQSFEAFKVKHKTTVIARGYNEKQFEEGTAAFPLLIDLQLS